MVTRTDCAQVVAALEGTGIAFLTVHGRTQEQRYKKAADWNLIARTAAATSLPIVGNGDILTHYEAAPPVLSHTALSSSALEGSHRLVSLRGQ